MSAARLALCGNVFRADTRDEVLAALRGPVAAWSGRLRAAGYARPVGYGLYLAAAAAAELARDPAGLELLRRELQQAGVEVWTANAFPYGGFHGARVKERAFEPDWRSPLRLAFTRDVAEILARLMPPGSHGSLSTCPLGYGPAARAAPAAWDNLRRAQDLLEELERRHGVRLVLALEPEPDGAFERIGELCEALAERLHGVPEPQRRVGVCWDLCHCAVVGESPAQVAAALRGRGAPLGKVQVSSALRLQGPPGSEAWRRLAELAQDPYFHQVRGDAGGGCFAHPDLPQFLEQAPAPLGEARIHCHVPLHRAHYGAGLTATDWRAGLQAAWAAGARDFEAETYTLPVLPRDFLEREGLVGTLAAETLAVAAALDATAAP